MNKLSKRTSLLFTDSTRDKLLKTSLNLFNEKGFNAVTTSSLACSAKVLEGTLWYHFKSKKNLVESHLDLFDKNFSLDLQAYKKISIDNLVNKLFSQYLYVWDFRYLFRNDLMNNFEKDKVFFKRLSNLDESRLNVLREEALFGRDVGIFDFQDSELEELIEIMFLIVYNWLDLCIKKYPKENSNFHAKKGSGLIIKVLEPYMSMESKKIANELHKELKI